MGANGSTTRNVSFGLDEDEKVTVVEGVKVTLHVTLTLAKLTFSVKVEIQS